MGLSFFCDELQTKYVGKEKGEEGFSIRGLKHMDKTLCVNGARISYKIWEVEGIDSFIQILLIFYVD